MKRRFNALNGFPGFTSKALSALKEKVENCGYEVCIALMFNEVSICKHINWIGKLFFGYTKSGSNVCNSVLECSDIISVTFDGTSTNFAVAEIMEAELHKPLQMRCYFYNPANEQKKISHNS